MSRCPCVTTVVRRTGKARSEKERGEPSDACSRLSHSRQITVATSGETFLRWLFCVGSHSMSASVSVISTD